MIEERGSYHIHMDEEPYCISFTYDRQEDQERREQAAISRAKDMGAAFVGPFDFDYDRCAYRRMMVEEAEQRQTEQLAAVEQDDTIPENERSYHPHYKGEVKSRPHSYHVHTDGEGWCRSFDSRRRALVWIRETAAAKHNARVVGPLRYPAIACKYFHDNYPEYLKG